MVEDLKMLKTSQSVEGIISSRFSRSSEASATELLDILKVIYS